MNLQKHTSPIKNTISKLKVNIQENTFQTWKFPQLSPTPSQNDPVP